MAITWNAVLRLSLVAALLVVMEARAASFQIEIDTASLGLNSQNWDLAFDLTDGNPQPNSVVISGFSIPGGALTSATPYYPSSGNVTGDLSVFPGIVTLNDFFPDPTYILNEYSHNANLGTSIIFVFEITGNFDSGYEPDTFSFFFIDPDPESESAGKPFPTSDPTGALFVYSIGNPNQPTVFLCLDNTEIECVTATPIAAVPEPGALALALAGLLALGALRSSRKSPLRG